MLTEPEQEEQDLEDELDDREQDGVDDRDDQVGVEASELEGAIRENDQERACAIAHRYGARDFDPRAKPHRVTDRVARLRNVRTTSVIFALTHPLASRLRLCDSKQR